MCRECPSCPIPPPSPPPHQWAITDMRTPALVRVVPPSRPSSKSRHKSHVSNRLRALARTLYRPCERTARAGSGVGTRPPRARAARAVTGNARGGGGKPSPTLGDALPWPLARRLPSRSGVGAERRRTSALARRPGSRYAGVGASHENTRACQRRLRSRSGAGDRAGTTADDSPIMRVRTVWMGRRHREWVDRTEARSPSA